MDHLIDKYLPRKEFDSYEDFIANFRIEAPEDFNFGFDVVDALLEGPSATEQDQLGVRTAIPAGTVLRSAALDAQGTLTVDLSAEFLSNAGDVLVDAVAQLIFTAAQLPGERRVRLLVEGEPQDWPTGSGTTREPLSIYDFIDRITAATVPPGAAPTTTSLPS